MAPIDGETWGSPLHRLNIAFHRVQLFGDLAPL
jgi:hypothetical protein